jgi:hypothetical protein
MTAVGGNVAQNFVLSVDSPEEPKDFLHSFNFTLQEDNNLAQLLLEYF